MQSFDKKIQKIKELKTSEETMIKKINMHKYGIKELIKKSDITDFKK